MVWCASSTRSLGATRLDESHVPDWSWTRSHRNAPRSPNDLSGSTEPDRHNLRLANLGPILAGCDSSLGRPEIPRGFAEVGPIRSSIPHVPLLPTHAPGSVAV